MQETNISFTQFNRIRNNLLDTGLRLDGLLALEKWDLIVSVFGSVSQFSDRRGRLVNVDVERNQKSHGKINVMENIDRAPSSVRFSHQGVVLYAPENNAGR